LQVAFDPLDGSSIFSANFAVGSIFGIWPGSTPLGQTGRDQAAAAYSIYGPRTLLVIAVPTSSAAAAGGSCSAANGQQQQQQQDQQPQQQQQQSCSGQQQHPSQQFDVLEFALSEGKGWKLRHVYSKLGNVKNIAPANIKAAKDNAVYEKLVLQWISKGCKLRYSGGMVPDVHHLIQKVRGQGWLCHWERDGCVLYVGGWAELAVALTYA
jgi:fructose-1,6-bisphosphatase